MSRNYSRTAFIILGIIILLLLIWYFRSIFFYIVISAVLSLLGEPVVKALQEVRIKTFRINKTWSAALTLLLLMTLFFGLISALIPLFIKQAQAIMRTNPSIVLQNLTEPIMRSEFFYSRFHDYLDYETIQNYLRERLELFFDLGRVTQILNTIAGLTGDIFIAIFSIAFITFFFLKDRSIPYNAIMLFTPEEHVKKVTKSILESKTLLTRYFIGVGIQVLLIISLVTLGLTLIGVRNAFFIGFIAGILNVVPYLGPLIGALFGILISVSLGLQEQTLSALAPHILQIAAVFVIVQLLDNFFFQPYIYSSSVKAHPLEIFLIILIAGKIAGIVGIILAIPVYTIIRVVAKQFLSRFHVIKKLTTTNNPSIE